MRVAILPHPWHIHFLSTGTGGHLFPGFLPFVGASAESVLFGQLTSNGLLWALGPLGRVQHGHPLRHARASCLGHSAPLAFPRLSLGCPGLRVGSARRTRWSSAYSHLELRLGLLQGARAVALGWSGETPGGSECRFHRLLQGMVRGLPLLGLLLLPSGRRHPRLWLRFGCK